MGKMNEPKLIEYLEKDLFDRIQRTIENWEIAMNDELLDRGYPEGKVNKCMGKVIKFFKRHRPQSVLKRMSEEEIIQEYPGLKSRLIRE